MPSSFRDISDVLAKIRDARTIDEFFESLLTKKEIADIASRWELVKLLDSGMSQREISRKLGLSLCKITRGARELKPARSALRRVLAISADKKKAKPFSKGDLK